MVISSFLVSFTSSSDFKLFGGLSLLLRGSIAIVISSGSSISGLLFVVGNLLLNLLLYLLLNGLLNLLSLLSWHLLRAIACIKSLSHRLLLPLGTARHEWRVRILLSWVGRLLRWLATRTVSRSSLFGYRSLLNWWPLVVSSRCRHIRSTISYNLLLLLLGRHNSTWNTQWVNSYILLSNDWSFSRLRQSRWWLNSLLLRLVLN